jgi:RNA polymerase sigma-70 factor (ECF subfamily)
MPSYPWLFWLAADRLARTHRDHVASTVRGIGRERRIGGPSPDESVAPRWGDRPAAAETTPRHRRAREGPRQLLTGAIERIDQGDRDILGLRHLDHLAFDEIAAVLEVGLGATRMRHQRALERLRRSLEELGVQPSTGA